LLKVSLLSVLWLLRDWANSMVEGGGKIVTMPFANSSDDRLPSPLPFILLNSS
jgi:hypothetical protein